MRETIFDKFLRLLHDIEQDILPNASFIERIVITFDFLWEKIRYDVELIDYVQ